MILAALCSSHTIKTHLLYQIQLDKGRAKKQLYAGWVHVGDALKIHEKVLVHCDSLCISFCFEAVIIKISNNHFGRQADFLPHITPSDVAILDNHVVVWFPFSLLVVTHLVSHLRVTGGYRQWGGDTVLRGGRNLCGFTDAVGVSWGTTVRNKQCVLRRLRVQDTWLIMAVWRGGTVAGMFFFETFFCGNADTCPTVRLRIFITTLTCISTVRWFNWWTRPIAAGLHNVISDAQMLLLIVFFIWNISQIILPMFILLQ